MANYTFGTINGIKYFQSKDIKVFPCAYRGYKDANAGIVYNPESRGFTEYNFSHTYENGSYLVSWEGTTLKCVIGGYYFEIYGVEPVDLADKELAIRVEAINLNTQSASANSEVDKTYVLKSFKTDNANYLDTQDGNSIYCFTGLAVLDPDHSETGLYARLKLVKTLQSSDSDEHKTYSVIQGTKRLDDVLNTGIGSYSIQTADDCSADGDYGIALGKNAKAIGNNSLALGKDVTAGSSRSLTVEPTCTQKAISGDGAVVIGTGSTVNASNAVAIGTGLEAGSNTFNQNADNLYVKTEEGICQVVLGKYNVLDTTSAFIFGWGADSGNKKNIFTISPAGDIKNTGASEIIGNLAVRGGTVNLNKGSAQNNVLNLGSTAANDTGALNIYGSGSGENSDVFAVSKTGATKIKSTLTVDGATTLKSPATIKGAITADARGTESTANTAGNNTLTLGSNQEYSWGAIDVYGNGTTKVFSVTKEGATTIEGAAVINSTLNTKGSITAENAASNILTLGGNTVAKGYGAIDVYGDETDKVFSVSKDGEAKLAGTLEVNGATTLKNSLSVTEQTTLGSTLSVTGNTTIGGTLAVIKALSSNRLLITTPNSGNYDENTPPDTRAFVITKSGNDVFKVTSDGNVVAVGNLAVGTTGLNIGDATVRLADAPSISDYASGQWNNTNAICLNTGLYTTGYITCKGKQYGASSLGGLVISDKDNNGVAYIDTAGAAWFAQKLEVGKNNYGVGEDSDEVFFRVLKERNNPAEATLEGNFTASGKLIIKNTAEINGLLTVGNETDTSALGLKVHGGVNVVGNIVGNAFIANSDARLKTNVKDFNYEKSILDLPVKEFEYINDDQDTKHIGCIAQDLQEICPELVHKDANGYLGIEENKLVYLLLKEVKKLREEINSLKGE